MMRELGMEEDKTLTGESVKTNKQSSREGSAVAIIGSVTAQQPGRPLSSFFKRQPPEIVPQTPAVLSDDDRQVLTELGLPPDKWDNLNVLLAIYNRAEPYDVFSVQVSKPGMELSRSYVLEQVEYLLMNSAKKEAVVIHYYGNGRRNTGDWCFQDGFITFRDIADLYMKHSRGRVLYLVPDCHSSGHWVVECAKFLDEQGVRPCGHSAREKGILIKVFASCGTHQESAELAYSTRAMGVDSDGLVYHWFCKMLTDQQTTFGIDFTMQRCGKEPGDKCIIEFNSTWAATKEITSDRIFQVHGTHRGKRVWRYVLLHDNPDKIREFKEKTQRSDASSYSLELSDYGVVLKSGWGDKPPRDIEEFMNNYSYCL